MSAEMPGVVLDEAGILLRTVATMLGSILVLAASCYAGPPLATPTAFCELLVRFSLVADAWLFSAALYWSLVALLGTAVVIGLAAALPGVAQTVPIDPGLTVLGIVVLAGACYGRTYDGLGRWLAGDGRDRLLARFAGKTDHEREVFNDLLTARFDVATRAAGIGVYEFDPDSNAVWWSDVMYDICGRTRETFEPTRMAWRAMIHSEDLARVLDLAAETGYAREPLDVRYRVVRPDGSVRHVQSIASSVASVGTGSSRRCIGVLLDVTDRIEAERRERALELRLRESSHQAGIAETANGVLQSVEQALSGVGVAASMMRRDLTALRPERVEQVAALIASHRVDIAAFLTEDVRGKYLPDYLLAIAQQLTANSSSLEAELGEINRHVRHLRDIISAQQSLIPMGGTLEPTDLRDLIEVALLVQAPDFAEIETQRVFEDLPLVLTDRHKLLQIIVCYVSNARDAMLLGGAAPPRIVLRLYRDGDDAVFSIQDTGPGMSEETLSHLWEFGFTTKRNGHGFGLHASAKAARDIGAIVRADSAGLGCGACFSVRLPLNGPASHAAGAEVESRAA
jgi:PAS domain S-box-containing protein